MVPKCFNCFIFQFLPGRRQFEKCSSQNGEPLATIEEEGFALHYDGSIHDATCDGAGLYLRIFRSHGAEKAKRKKSLVAPCFAMMFEECSSQTTIEEEGSAIKTVSLQASSGYGCFKGQRLRKRDSHSTATAG